MVNIFKKVNRWIREKKCKNIPIGSKWKRNKIFGDNTECIVEDVDNGTISVKTTNLKYDYQWTYEPDVFKYLYNRIKDGEKE